MTCKPTCSPYDVYPGGRCAKCGSTKAERDQEHDDATRTNLQYCDQATRDHVARILADPAVHQITKDTIRAGLRRDCLDAARDVADAAAALELVRVASRRGRPGRPTLIDPPEAQ